MGRCVLSDCVPFPIMAAPAPLTPGVATQVTTFANNRQRMRHRWLEYGARLAPLQDELETSFLQPVLQGGQRGMSQCGALRRCVLPLRMCPCAARLAVHAATGHA